VNANTLATHNADRMTQSLETLTPTLQFMPIYGGEHAVITWGGTICERAATAATASVYRIAIAKVFTPSKNVHVLEQLHFPRQSTRIVELSGYTRGLYRYKL
jgi:hypothetical protein